MHTQGKNRKKSGRNQDSRTVDTVTAPLKTEEWRQKQSHGLPGVVEVPVIPWVNANGHKRQQVDSVIANYIKVPVNVFSATLE